MAFYIDCADVDVVEELWSTGLFAGVTCNPTILARAGLAQRDIPALHRDLVAMGVEEVFAQVLGADTAEMARSAAWLRTIGDVVVKVPATVAGLRLVRDLAADGVPTLVTAVYHPTQALLARDVGADWVAPYVGRMSDSGRPGVDAVSQMVDALAGSRTQVLAASLRSPDQVAELAAVGVRHQTLGAEVARRVLHDELTAAAVVEFERQAAEAELRPAGPAAGRGRSGRTG